MAWKWVTISLHGALYGFAICASKGTDPSNVTYRRKDKKSPNEKQPFDLDKEKLLSFGDALKVCQDQNWHRGVMDGKPLVMTPDQQKAVDELHKRFRNVFEHFIPHSWSIELHGFPEISVHVLDVIQFLAIDSSTPHLILTTTERRKLKSLVIQSKKLLKRHPLHLELQQLESGKAEWWKPKKRKKRNKGLAELDRILEQDEQQRQQARQPADAGKPIAP